GARGDCRSQTGNPRDSIVLDAELDELALQGRPADSEDVGGVRAIAVRRLEHAQDVIALDVLEPLRSTSWHRAAQRRRQVLEIDRAAAGEDHRALERVAQLAHVARPVVLLERGDDATVERRLTTHADPL